MIQKFDEYKNEFIKMLTMASNNLDSGHQTQALLNTLIDNTESSDDEDKLVLNARIALGQLYVDLTSNNTLKNSDLLETAAANRRLANRVDKVALDIIREFGPNYS